MGVVCFVKGHGRGSRVEESRLRDADRVVRGGTDGPVRDDPFILQWRSLLVGEITDERGRRAPKWMYILRGWVGARRVLGRGSLGSSYRLTYPSITLPPRPPPVGYSRDLSSPEGVGRRPGPSSGETSRGDSRGRDDRGMGVVPVLPPATYDTVLLTDHLEG